MNNDPHSHGLWERTAPLPPATPPLEGEASAEVAVVGGGFTGLSAALHLAEAGVSVAVLEAVEIGFGGSGRNVGLVNAGLWLMPDDVVKALGPVHGERVLDLLGQAPRLVFDLISRHGISCEAEPVGTLHCAVGPAGQAEIAERARQWQARGAPVTLLDAAAAEQAIGARAYAGALLDRRAGTVQPLAYVRGLARAAQGAGARIHTRSPVTGATREGAAWRLTTPQGRLTAPRVILATNAYGEQLWPEVRAELVPLPYFQFATEPLGHNLRRTILPGRQGAWDTREVLSSFRIDHAGRLVFGSVGALRGTGRAVHEAWARRAIRRLFPDLGRVTFESAWYGRIGMTDDAVPRLHRLAEDVVSLSGYNGRGIAPGTAFGRVLADHLLGRTGADDLPLPWSEPKPAAWRGLKAAYYELGAQAAHLL